MNFKEMPYCLETGRVRPIGGQWLKARTLPHELAWDKTWNTLIFHNTQRKSHRGEDNSLTDSRFFKNFLVTCYRSAYTRIRP